MNHECKHSNLGSPEIRNQGSSFGGPHNKGYLFLGVYIGPPVYGNYQTLAASN